jgi:hypothetical protein
VKQRFIEWLEHRTGLETALKSFFNEEIPASSGWRQLADCCRGAPHGPGAALGHILYL